MLIRVRYPDGATRMVRPQVLNQLIRTRMICEFRRANGWVRLGVDPVRRFGAGEYRGAERRNEEAASLTTN